MFIDVSADLHAFAESLMVNVFIADKDFNVVFMNASARKSLVTRPPESSPNVKLIKTIW